jgi:hypothetical protein
MLRPAALLAVFLAAPAFANQVVFTAQCAQAISAGGAPAPFNVGACVFWDEGLDCVPTAAGHSLYRYDVASTLAPGSVVNSVALGFACIVFNSGGNIEAHSLSIPWNCQTLTWTGPIGGYGLPVGPVLDAHFVFSGQGTVTMTSAALVAMVQSWADQPWTNNGLMLTPTTPACGTFEAYLSTPTLTVDYTPPCPGPTSYCVAAPNSVGPGARISIAGSTHVSDHAMTVVVTGVRPGAAGLVFFGGGQQQIPVGNGFFCVDAPMFRVLPGTIADPNGTIVKPIDFDHGSGLNLVPGSVWNFQCQYRDIAGGGAGFNFSDGVTVTICP